MIIKFLPETDAEKARMKEQFGTDKIIHKNVREYFVFGNKQISESQRTDFHEWVGSHRYLMSNLNYFYELVNDERRNNESSEIQQPKPMKFIDVAKEEEDGNIGNSDVVANVDRPRLIKHGTVREQNITQIDTDNIKHGTNPKIVNMTEKELDNIGEKIQEELDNIGQDEYDADFDTNDVDTTNPPIQRPTVTFVKGK
jgi:hypothetical protein